MTQNVNTPHPESSERDSDPADRLKGITLQRGGHESPDEGLCFMEFVAFVRGIPHTDHPPCVSPVLGEMGRSLNDSFPDDVRQLLIPLEPLMPGTVNDGHDETRSYLALDWLIRTWLPAWLELSPACRDDAARIRELGKICDLVSAERAGPIVRDSRKHAAAARAAAWDAAEDAAGAAAEDAAGAAAWDAAWARLAPTVAELQVSAIDLYRHMALVGRDETGIIEDGLR